MSSEGNEMFVAAVAIIIDSALHVQKKRRFWVRPSLKSRTIYSGSDLMKDLILDEVNELNVEYRCDIGFRNFFRMTNNDFETLLTLIAPTISKKDTSFRPAIPACERLAVTLRFFATGDSYHSLSYAFKISKQLISRTIPEVCEALLHTIKDYVKMPKTEEDWELIAKQFNDRWNFPNCVGAMDGKHVTLQAPINSGTEYFNYKSFFSIVLFAVVDANYNFIYANAGCQGRISDGGVFNETYFKECLEENKMHLPSPRQLPGESAEVPFVFVADDAFPLSMNIMKPFPGCQDKGSSARIFNYRLSRARRVSENCFGILSAVFRVLRRPMLLEPSKAKLVVLTLVHLHNFLRKKSSKPVYNPPRMVDVECSDTGDVNPGLWRRDTSNVELRNFARTARRSSAAAQDVRKELAQYFMSPEGELHFQYDK